jgi:hypothetical protein
MPKLEWKTVIWIWMISGCVALVSVLPVLGFCSEGGPCVMFVGIFQFVGFVGTKLSAILSSLDVPNPVLVVLFNWILFALVAIVIAKLVKHRAEGQYHDYR